MNLIHHDKKQLDGTAPEGKRNIESKELIKCLQRLEYKGNLLERDIQAFINDTNINPHIKQNSRNIAHKYTKRPDDLKQLRNDLWIVSKDLKSVKSMMDDIEKLDVNVYQKKLSQVAYKICNFKELLNPGTLTDEQVRLESSVNTILAKYRFS